jgi:hypothetical protein
MKITFILRDLSDCFYDDIKQLSEIDVFKKLNSYCFGDLKMYVSQKIGNGSFRDKVELNQIMRNVKTITYKIEPRKGYKLATFEII